MVSRSLPERTVDAWVSAVVCRQFPNALVWGPTQVVQDENWDYGASLGDGKVFILEDKATSPVTRKRKAPLATHWIDIPRSQLNWYCDDVQPRVHVPVFYVLPAPPWTGTPTGSVVVPDQAACRVASPAGPFEEWAFVVAADDLRTYLGARRGLETVELPIASSRSLAAFLDEVRSCRLGYRVGGGGGGASAAMKGLDQGDRGRNNVASGPVARRDESDRRMGSALAVFVPAGDLPGW